MTGIAWWWMAQNSDFCTAWGLKNKGWALYALHMQGQGAIEKCLSGGAFVYVCFTVRAVVHARTDVGVRFLLYKQFPFLTPAFVTGTDCIAGWVSKRKFNAFRECCTKSICFCMFMEWSNGSLLLDSQSKVWRKPNACIASHGNFCLHWARPNASNTRVKHCKLWLALVWGIEVCSSKCFLLSMQRSEDCAYLSHGCA